MRCCDLSIINYKNHFKINNQLEFIKIYEVLKFFIQFFKKFLFNYFKNKEIFLFFQFFLLNFKFKFLE